MMNDLKPNIRGMLFLTGAFALAGTSVISARFVTGRLGTFTISAISLFFALLILIPLAGNKTIESIRNTSIREWVYLFIQALFGIFLFRMFLLLGLTYTTSVEAGILTGSTPAITTILSLILLREKMNAGKIIGILSTITGILFIQGLPISRNAFLLDHIFGNILVLCAAACESLFNVFSRIAVINTQLINKTHIPPMVKTLIVSFIAMFLCLIPAFFEHPINKLIKLEMSEWLSLIWYGVFVTALAFLFWYSGIKRCTASTAAAFSGMMPFTALLLSVLILGERASIHQWGGGLLVISGMMLISILGEKNNRETVIIMKGLVKNNDIHS